MARYLNPNVPDRLEHRARFFSRLNARAWRARNQTDPTGFYVVEEMDTRGSVVMIRSVVSAVAFGFLCTTSAFAIAPNCKDQLADIKSQATSEVLAQSALGKKYEEANRLCAAGDDMHAQALAREIHEEMASKQGSAGAQESAGSSVNGAPEAPKGSQVTCPDGKPALVAGGAYRCPRSD